MSAVLESVMTEVGRKGLFLQTYSGKKFYPEDPRPEDFDMIDIAVALGNFNRYGGHCKPYSVAEHSILVSRMVPDEFAIDGLLHDAEEAYISDIIWPVKQALGKDNKLFKLSDNIRSMLAIRFGEYGLKWPEPECVHHADRQICLLEKKALHPRSDEWDLGKYSMPMGLAIRCYTNNIAADLFLKRFCDLTGQRFFFYLERLEEYRDQDEKAFRHQQEESDYGR